MERLTFDGNFCDIAQCRNIPGGSFCEDGACYQKKVWERLKQFEDTVRAPELFFKMYGELPLLESAIKNYGSHDRMKEIAKADKDGRVVVQPCKVGDKLYRVFAGEIFEHRVGSLKYFAIQGRWDFETYPFCPCVESSIGKTVFFSREEAEKALAEMEGKKDD